MAGVARLVGRLTGDGPRHVEASVAQRVGLCAGLHDGGPWHLQLLKCGVSIEGHGGAVGQQQAAPRGAAGMHVKHGWGA